MRRVVARQNVERAVSDTFEKRIDIALRPKRRIHLEVRVEVLNRLVRQRDVMRTNFAADLDPARSCFAQEPHAPRGADVLAMNVVIASLGQQNIAGDDRFLACRQANPAAQAEYSNNLRAPRHCQRDRNPGNDRAPALRPSARTRPRDA